MEGVVIVLQNQGIRVAVLRIHQHAFLTGSADTAFAVSLALRYAENGLRMQNPPIPDTVARHCSNE
jgi:hypothetical protein